MFVVIKGFAYDFTYYIYDVPCVVMRCVISVLALWSTRMRVEALGCFWVPLVACP